MLSTGQTSLIVDPPNGRAPVRDWALENKVYNLAHNGDHYRNMSVWDRCLSRGVPGSMLPAGYNNAYRIVQTPDHVVIQHEMIHDVRIIPFRDKPFIDDNIRQWMGDARAHWEGDTLVVETKNFHNRGWIASSGAGARLKGIAVSKALHVVERFRRVSENTIIWTVTIEDSERLHASLDDSDAPHCRARLRDLRVRLPRGELRGAQRTRWAAGNRRAGRGSRNPGSVVAGTATPGNALRPRRMSFACSDRV